MQTSGLDTEKSYGTPPSKSRTWKIIAIVFALHVVLFGGLVLIQGCSKSETSSTKTAEDTSASQPQDAAQILEKENALANNALAPDSHALTPEEKSLDDGKTAKNDLMPAPIKPDPAVMTPVKPSVDDSTTSKETVATKTVPTKKETVSAKKETATTVKSSVKHEVAKGETLSKIATKYHLKVADLAVANKISAETPLKIGQKLVVPTSKASAKATKASVATVTAEKSSGSSVNGQVHVVKQGESLAGIARQYGVSLESLMNQNHITDPKKLQINQKLTIPAATVKAQKQDSSQLQRARQPQPILSEESSMDRGQLVRG